MAGEPGRSREHCALQSDPIDPAALAELIRTDASGALVTFAGVVRDHHRGKPVESLTYEAYGPMADKEMRRIAAETRGRWSLEGIAIVHRVGHLKIGEISVAIVVASAHRREAMEACAHAIDQIKRSVPIWKKEHGDAWEGWVIGDDSPGSAVDAVSWGGSGPSGSGDPGD